MAGCGLESQMLGIGGPFFDQIVEYAPKGPKGDSKRPKGTPKGPKGAHKGPKGTPKGPKGAPKGSYCFRRKHASQDIVLILEDSVIYVNKRETDQIQRKMTKGGVSPKTQS